MPTKASSLTKNIGKQFWVAKSSGPLLARLSAHYLSSHWLKAPGVGDSAYERGGDARRKFCIKPLKETGLGVAQAFF